MPSVGHSKGSLPGGRRVWVPVLLFSASLAACGGGEGGREAASDTLTRRQKDSLISTMPVPGASAVGKALRAADSASARAQRHDSLIK